MLFRVWTYKSHYTKALLWRSTLYWISFLSMISPRFEPLVQLVLHSFKHFDLLFQQSNRILQPRTPSTLVDLSRPWAPWDPWSESAAHGPPVLQGHLQRNASRSVELDRPWRLRSLEHQIFCLFHLGPSIPPEFRIDGDHHSHGSWFTVSWPLTILHFSFSETGCGVFHPGEDQKLSRVWQCLHPFCKKCSPKKWTYLGISWLFD